LTRVFGFKGQALQKNVDVPKLVMAASFTGSYVIRFTSKTGLAPNKDLEIGSRILLIRFD
jgi:hypothetical protein